jgi:hypothetical protein
MFPAHPTASADIKAVAVDPVLDAEMDRVLMDTFPASDPPQWDSLAARRPSVRSAAVTGANTRRQ